MKFTAVEYAASEDLLFEAQLAETGYKKLTTFYIDLSVAEFFGDDPVMETYDKICKDWIGDYKYFTEFVMCLNYKAWEHNDRHNYKLSSLYSELYYEARDLFYDHYNGDDPKSEEARDYFFETTD